MPSEKDIEIEKNRKIMHDYEQLQKIFERISKIRNPGFRLGNISIDADVPKIVLTPYDKDMLGPDKNRKLEIIIEKGFIIISSAKANNSSGIEFVRSISDELKKDDYLHLNYFFKIRV